MVKKKKKKIKGGTQMNQLLLNKFQNYVVTHYSECNLNTKSICFDLSCSVSTLHRILIQRYNYSIMKYVEYFRILKAIELIYYKGEKKVCYKVGYNSSSVFSKSFLRVTGFNARYFFYYQLAEHKNIMRTALEVATENPKKALELIRMDVSERYMLSK
jgi:AraC-like DNA-binding protein